MRKILFFLTAVCTLFLSNGLEAQNVRFGKYFKDNTLLIRYHRIGNRQHDTVRIASWEQIPQWAGSLTQLIDPFDNGDYRVVVTDTKRGKVLYSRGYNTLFQEYRDTPEGMDSVAAFEEVVRVPWPKRAVNICFLKRDSLQHYYTQFVYRFDPDDGSVGSNSDAGNASFHYGAGSVGSRNVDIKPIRLQYKGDIHHKIDVVIVPEGYGPADTAKMMRDMRAFRDFLLGQEPFFSRTNDFNVWGVPLTGEASGITDPNKGIHVNSLVGSSYNTFGADRYLMTSHIFQLHDAIGWTPCDHIIIMANSTTYGGGAIYNFYAMSSLNERAFMILPHELGHSIGGLADEYVDEDLSYGEMHKPTQEPLEPNITTLVDFSSKWKSLVPEGTPIPTPADPSIPYNQNGPLGAYEGAGYHAKGFYRPTMRCMMRDYAPFCPVCRQRLNEVFDLYVK